MKEKLERFIQLLIKILQKSENNEKLKEIDAKEFEQITRELMEFLITNPGGFIFIDDKDKIRAYKFAVQRLYELYSPEEIIDEILEGGFGGLLLDSIDDYAYRATKLKPLFLTFKPENKEFYTYYNEAMNCWLHGLNNSSIIIISSLIENILKEKILELPEKDIIKIVKIIKEDEEIKRIEASFFDLIDLAKEKKLISESDRNILHELRTTRNKIVHSGYSLKSDESLILVEKTKEVIERLLN
ncbi:MAG: DUF4145 domain-containing protein [Promethearchaeota archaeon]